MSTLRTTGIAALVALAAAGLEPSRAHAGVVFNYAAKGGEGIAQFHPHETINCAGGGSAILDTFISMEAFQTTVLGKNNTTTTENFVQIVQTNGCTGAQLFDFSSVEANTLTMNGVQSGTIAVTFPLFISGGTLTMNLTLTSNGTITQGITLDRTHIAPLLIIGRTVGQQSETTIGGTVTLNGQPIHLVNLTEVISHIANNTAGEIIVIGARTH